MPALLTPLSLRTSLSLLAPRLLLTSLSLLAPRLLLMSLSLLAPRLLLTSLSLLATRLLLTSLSLLAPRLLLTSLSLLAPRLLLTSLSWLSLVADSSVALPSGSLQGDRWVPRRAARGRVRRADEGVVGRRLRHHAVRHLGETRHDREVVTWPPTPPATARVQAPTEGSRLLLLNVVVT